MIEVQLALKLDSFLVNSMGKSEDVSCQMSAKALNFSCEKIAAVRQLTENKPSAEFEFLGAASKREVAGESEQEFDDKFSKYLAAHTTVDTSRINIAFGAAGYVPAAKGISSGEIGRMYITELPNQSSLELELVLKRDEFDAAWELMTQQKIRNVIVTLACFKLMPGALADKNGSLFVAGVLSSSLRLVPHD